MQLKKELEDQQSVIRHLQEHIGNLTTEKDHTMEELRRIKLLNKSQMNRTNNSTTPLSDCTNKIKSSVPTAPQELSSL